MPDNRDKLRGLLFGSFLGDSLSLGPHWIYDPSAIKQAFGRVGGLAAPLAKYHAGKEAGDFTHYGDQTLVLLDSVADTKGFSLDDYFARWQAMMENYGGYKDMATKKTLERIQFGEGPDGSGSPSDDLAGASRIAPLALVAGSEDDLLDMALAQTRMTHNQPLVLDSAAALARTLWAVLQGEAPLAALEKAGQAKYLSAPMAQWIQAGIETKDDDTTEVINRFGASCHTPSAFPGLVHVLAKYPDDLEEALVENAMAGGDSAARALILGMLLGAAQGEAALPQAWLADLKARQHIEDALAKLD